MKNIWGGGKTMVKATPTHSGKPPTEDFWLPLCSSSFPQYLCSLYVPSAFCLQTSIWLCLFIFISFIFSLIPFCTHSGIHEHIHTLTHTHKHARQKWEPVVALEQESVDERRPICDWMTEWFKEWRAKAVKLSVSLHRSRRWELMPRCKRGQPDPELEALELASSFKLTVLIIVLMVFMRWSW